MIGLGLLAAIIGFVCHLHGYWMTYDYYDDASWVKRAQMQDPGQGYKTVGIILLIAGCVLIAGVVLYEYRRGIGLTITGGTLFLLAFICSEAASKYGESIWDTETREDLKNYVVYMGASNTFAITSLAFLGVGIIASISFFIYKNYYVPRTRLPAGPRPTYTRPYVPTVSRVTDGRDVTLRCPQCGSIVFHSSKFCSACGASIPQTKTCKSCGFVMPYENKYCPQCGEADKPKPLTMTCSHCGASVGISNKYCTRCGALMEQAPTKRITCPQCGNLVPTGNKFCSQCGTNVSEASSHSWRCAHCGNMVSEEICPFCGEASQSER